MTDIAKILGTKWNGISAERKANYEAKVRAGAVVVGGIVLRRGLLCWCTGVASSRRSRSGGGGEGGMAEGDWQDGAREEPGQEPG